MPHETNIAVVQGPAGRSQDGAREIQAIPITRTHAAAGLRLVSRFGIMGTGVAAIVLGWFMGSTTIAGAVMSSGTLVVDSGAKQVQPPWGGVVSAVLAHNGDRVVAGQAVVQLDSSVATAKLASAMTQLTQHEARLARLFAERDGLDAPQFDGLTRDAAISDAEFVAILSTEHDQFSSRREALDGQLAQLDQQIAQVEADAEANTAQLNSMLEQLKLIEARAASYRDLYAKELIPYSQVSAAELSLAEARGTEGRLRAAVTASQGKLAELRVTKIQVEREWRADVSNQIAQAQSINAGLIEQLALARDELQRLTIRAPQDGFVHELAAMTSGSVVQPAEKLMLVVPDHDKLVGEVKIHPSDIDQLYPSQPVNIQLSAFERATTPSIEGVLTSISADLVEDPRTGVGYYTARIEISADALPGLKLLPGMPIEAFIRTEDRTILSYLTKPLTDQMNRAFR